MVDRATCCVAGKFRGLQHLLAQFHEKLTILMHVPEAAIYAGEISWLPLVITAYHLIIYSASGLLASPFRLLAS
jgi:hypothetical protein